MTQARRVDERERSPPNPALLVDCAALVHPTVLVRVGCAARTAAAAKTHAVSFNRSLSRCARRTLRLWSEPFPCAVRGAALINVAASSGPSATGGRGFSRWQLPTYLNKNQRRRHAGPANGHVRLVRHPCAIPDAASGEFPRAGRGIRPSGTLSRGLTACAPSRPPNKPSGRVKSPPSTRRRTARTMPC